jgi:hypothetical protein
VRPAVDLDDVASRVEMVVDDMRVGDEEALIAGQHVVDGVARMIRRELEGVRLFSDVAETKEIDHLTLLRRDFGMGSGSGTLASS